LQWAGYALSEYPLVKCLILTVDQNYALQWLCILPLEIISASITIDFWYTAQKYDHAIFVTVFLLVVVSINLFGVRGYGEGEFIFSIVKVAAVIGYM
jgi:amino acid transporter